MTNTKSIGERSEGLVLARFLQLGWVVLLPFGDNQRYDMVIDRGQGFERIQVKTGHIKKGTVRFETASTVQHRCGKRKSYHGQIEHFAVYCSDNHQVYLIPVDVFNMGGSLRIDPPKNSQIEGIKWAKDYQI